MGRDNLIREAEGEFQNLVSAIDGLSDEQMNRVWYGDWCVRDILAHVSGWHREMTGVFERIYRGERPVPEGVDYNEADAWNARFAEAHRGTSPAAMVKELHVSEEAFLAAARQIPEERFEEGRAGNRILHSTGIDHYREHVPAIREWRKREGI